MPGIELLAAGGLGAKATFDYNRENFLYDRELRMKKEFQLMEFRCEQAGQWREDVRDLISLTEYKMHVYLLVNVLMVGFTVVLWCEGRLPETTPDWMMMGSALSITGAFMFLLLSIWMAMHAAVAAQGYETRLLTQLVRLPIPTWQELEACRTCGSDFEKLEPKQMFRVPFVQGRQEDVMRKTAANGEQPAEREGPARPGQVTVGIQAAIHGDQQASAPAASDPWGLERTGDGIYELGTQEGSEIAKLRHIKLARQAMVYWQTYDAFARVSMSVGVIELLLAMSYYVLGYVLVQDGCRTAATYGVILLTVMAESTTKMDMSLPLWEIRLVQVLLFSCPMMSCVAGFHWSFQSNFSLKVAEACIVVAFLSHGLFLALMTHLCRISEQDNGTLLPVAFRSVLYLDVFGWLRGTEGLEEPVSPMSPARGAWSQRSRRASMRARGERIWSASQSPADMSSLWARATNRGGSVNAMSLGARGMAVARRLAPVREDAYTGHDELRPSTETVHYNDDGYAVPQRPEDAVPHGIQQDFRNEKGAPQGTFAKDAKAFFSPARWMQGEASRPADRCACGNIFMDDAIFCRRCGVERPEEEEESQDDGTEDEHFATGHESHNPGILPWRVFSSVMVLLCLAWLFGGVYHLLSLTNLIEKDEPLVWEAEHPGSDEPWERELPRPPKSSFFLSLLKTSASSARRIPFSMQVSEHAQKVETMWPHANVRPLSLACDADGRRFVVADRFRTFVAQLPGSDEFSLAKKSRGRAHRPLKQDDDARDVGTSLRQLTTSTKPASLNFRELQCPALLGEGLQDAAVSCGNSGRRKCDGQACVSRGPGDAEDGSAADIGVHGESCRALVLHRHGRRMSSCPIAAPGSSGVASLSGAERGGLVANLSDAWLEVSRRDLDDVEVDSKSNTGSRGPHARIEKTVAFSIDPSCWGGIGQVPRRCAGAFAATSKGRVVQLQQHSRRAELVPAEVLAEGVHGLAPSALGPGAVRALGGGYLGILQEGGKKIQVLDLNRGGVHAGKIRLPQSRSAAAFCAGGGYIWFLGDGTSPSLQRVPLPSELVPEEDSFHTAGL